MADDDDMPKIKIATPEKPIGTMDGEFVAIGDTAWVAEVDRKGKDDRVREIVVTEDDVMQKWFTGASQRPYPYVLAYATRKAAAFGLLHELQRILLEIQGEADMIKQRMAAVRAQETA